MEGSAQKREKGVTEQVWSPTSPDRKRYSVSKVRLPAGLNNRLPAQVMLSIVLVFYTCQEEYVTNLGGIKVPELWKRIFR